MSILFAVTSAGGDVSAVMLVILLGGFAVGDAIRTELDEALRNRSKVRDSAIDGRVSPVDRYKGVDLILQDASNNQPARCIPCAVKILNFGPGTTFRHSISHQRCHNAVYR